MKMMIARWAPRALEASFSNAAGRDMGWPGGLFSDVFRAFDRGSAWEAEAATYPKVDIAELADEYVLRADLPGFAREDVEIDVAEDRLTLRSHHQEEQETAGECVVCRERSSRSFERTLPFPGEVRTEDVRAVMANGLLTVHLPKTAVVMPRRIEVTDH